MQQSVCMYIYCIYLADMQQKTTFFQKWYLWNLYPICFLFKKILPEEKPRLMHAVWSPDQVVMALELGIDIFDSWYP